MALRFRSRAFWVAMGHAGPVWLAIGGVVVAAAIALLPSDPAAGVRYAGTLLQVGGLGTVAWGLHEVRRQFRQPSMLTAAGAWLRRIAASFRPAEPITLEAHLEAHAVATAEFSRYLSAGPNSAVERRLEILETNLSQLRGQLESTNTKRGEQICKLEDAIKHARAVQETNTERLSKQLENWAVGGLQLEMVGVVWLTAGVLGTSIPQELAAVLRLVAG